MAERFIDFTMILSFRNILVGFILAFVLFSCGKNNCLSSAGSIVQEERVLEAFQYIETYGTAKLYLKNDTVHKVTIEAGNKLIPNIETTVENGVLTIKDLNKCDFMKGYRDKKIYISVDTLKEININDAADLYTVDTFMADNLKVKFLSELGSCDLNIDVESFQLQIWYASGDFKVKGNVYSAYLNTESTSFIYADSLNNTSCEVNNNSMGDVYFKAGRWMYITIKNSGNIYYTGEPEEVFIKELSGSGKLIKKLD